MTKSFAIALVAVAGLAGCFGPQEPFDAIGEDEAIPGDVLARVPASVAREDIRERGGCYFFILEGQEFPVESAPGQQICV